MLVAYIFNFDHLDILWVSIRCASQKLFKMLRPFEFANGFFFDFELLHILWISIENLSKNVVDV